MVQASLLDYRAPDSQPAQLARPSGMQRAADRADRSAPGWTDRAYDALLAAARTFGDPFTIEQARTLVVVDAPPDKRAWGSVVNRASRRGAIVRTGGCAPAASSNGSVKPLWVVAR